MAIPDGDLNGQKLPNIEDCELIIEDGAGNQVSMQFIGSIKAAHSKPSGPIRDRTKIRGYGKEDAEGATITIEGTFTGLETRANGTGYTIQPMEIMLGQNSGFVSDSSAGCKPSFIVKIQVSDCSTSAESKQYQYNGCVLDNYDVDFQPVANAISVTIKSRNEDPVVTTI